MTYQELKKIGTMELRQDGKFGIYPRKKLTKKEQEKVRDYMQANKEALIAQFQAEKEEERIKREADDAANVTFSVVGWEAHKVTVDTRKDIDEQIRKIAEYYANDGITFESAREDYDKAITELTARKESKRDEERRVQALFAAAAGTGKRQKIRSYVTECDDPNEECSEDYVAEYAMPDGSLKIEREHTW